MTLTKIFTTAIVGVVLATPHVQAHMIRRAFTETQNVNRATLTGDKIFSPNNHAASCRQRRNLMPETISSVVHVPNALSAFMCDKLAAQVTEATYGKAVNGPAATTLQLEKEDVRELVELGILGTKAADLFAAESEFGIWTVPAKVETRSTRKPHVDLPPDGIAFDATTLVYLTDANGTLHFPDTNESVAIKKGSIVAFPAGTVHAVLDSGPRIFLGPFTDSPSPRVKRSPSLHERRYNDDDKGFRVAGSGTAPVNELTEYVPVKGVASHGATDILVYSVYIQNPDSHYPQIEIGTILQLPYPTYQHVEVIGITPGEEMEYTLTLKDGIESSLSSSDVLIVVPKDVSRAAMRSGNINEHVPISTAANQSSSQTDVTLMLLVAFIFVAILVLFCCA